MWKKGRRMSTAITIIGIISLLYFIAVICYAGVRASFAPAWLAIGFFSLAAGRILSYSAMHPDHKILPPGIRYAIIAAVSLGMLIFLFVEGCIVSGMFQKGRSDLDYVIILGAQVRGSRPSESLVRRLDRAVSYLNENEETTVIVSGGRGPGENITEAKAMEQYLLKHGIGRERILMEDRSTSTVENLKFSFQMTGSKTASVGIITNNFHVYRAVQIGRKMGFQEVFGIAASSNTVLQANYMLREFFAVVKEKLVGNI